MISPKKDGAAFFVHKMGKVVNPTFIDFVLCDLCRRTVLSKIFEV